MLLARIAALIFRFRSGCGLAADFHLRHRAGTQRKSWRRKPAGSHQEGSRLPKRKINHIRQAIEQEGGWKVDLRKEIQMISPAIEIQRIAHSPSPDLPVRGQRTAHQRAHPQGRVAAQSQQRRRP